MKRVALVLNIARSAIKGSHSKVHVTACHDSVIGSSAGHGHGIGAHIPVKIKDLIVARSRSGRDGSGSVAI